MTDLELIDALAGMVERLRDGLEETGQLSEGMASEVEELLREAASISLRKASVAGGLGAG